MTPESVSFVCGAGAFLLLLGLTPFVVRAPLRLSPVSRLTVAALLLHIAATGLTSYLHPDATYWHGAALYWFGFNCLVYCFGAVYKSVSLGILCQLTRHDDGVLSVDGIANTNITPCFAERLELLVQSGLAQKSGGRFECTAKGRKVAARISAVRKFFGILAGGLYIQAQPEKTKRMAG